MFDKADILARLQSGASADDIAKEMSDALNAAQKAYEETAKADAVMEAKREGMCAILGAVADYLLVLGMDEEAKDVAELAEDNETVDGLIQKVDELVELAQAIDKLSLVQFAPIEKKSCGKGDCGCDKPVIKLQGKSLDDPDLIIKSFLRGI